MAELKSMKITLDFDNITNQKLSTSSNLNDNGIFATSKQTLHVHEDEPSQRKGQIWKNMLLISCGFLFLFTAFSSLQNLQSSLNKVEGLGVASLSTIYGSLVISCMFVPSLIINKLGCKWTIVASMLMYTSYMAANFYAQWYTLIPTAIILGMGAAPLWSAKCTYLTQIGNEYANHVGQKAEVIVVRFFGIFFMIFQSGQIIGNLISSYVLKPGESENFTITAQELLKCGPNYCPTSPPAPVNGTNGTTDEPETDSSMREKVYLLCGIYVGCALMGALIVAVFVDSLQRTKGSATGKGNATTGFKLLIATFRHLRNRKQILLIPLTMFSGLEQSFIAADYTLAFVTCSMGIHQVGFVMVCYGVVDAICCIAFEPIVKKFSRVPVFLMGALVNAGVVVTMLLWHPDPSTPVIFYVLSGLWGLSDAIWQTQINAFYGVIFRKNEEAAFSNYRLWESLGFVLPYAYSNFICIVYKIYILLGFLGVGIIGYFLIELELRREIKFEKKNEKKPE